MFLKVLANSLNTSQVNYLGEQLHSSFNVYKLSGFGLKMPLPQRIAAETLLNNYNSEEEMVELFTHLLLNEDKWFYNTTLHIWGKEDFIALLKKYKWIYNYELMRFFQDPFYEHEINFLNKIRVLDLRDEYPIGKIVKEIEKHSKKLSNQDLEWRITMRLYDLDPEINNLVRKIISMLLARQNLQAFTIELFTCLKELAINASKANYKILFEKFVTRKQGVKTEENYEHFLRLFKEEIMEHGNQRLIKLARDEDKFINITFQSTEDAVEIWVTNNQNISIIEKREILKRINDGGLGIGDDDDDKYAEGAGMGINLILLILQKYSRDKHPLKVIFYPEFVKIGFSLKREELEEGKKEKENA
ncbi:hypothetical protein ACFL20_09970 [Spirochaetota bacterium]